MHIEYRPKTPGGTYRISTALLCAHFRLSAGLVLRHSDPARSLRAQVRPARFCPTRYSTIRSQLPSHLIETIVGTHFSNKSFLVFIYLITFEYNSTTVYSCIPVRSNAEQMVTVFREVQRIFAHLQLSHRRYDY